MFNEYFNGGIHNFTKAVSLELKNEIRINVVSSGLVEHAIGKAQDNKFCKLINRGNIVGREGRRHFLKRLNLFTDI